MNTKKNLDDGTINKNFTQTKKNERNQQINQTNST